MAIPVGNELIGDYLATDTPNSPQGGESRQEGDDHLRGIKGSLKRTFPNLSGQPSGVVNPNEDEFNTLVGISTTDPIITLPSGTKMLFYQAAAPSGWTLDASVDEHAVRLTSTIGGTSGGTYDFVDLFDNKGEGAVPGVGNHLLTGAESGEKGHNHGSHRHRIMTGTSGLGGNRTTMQTKTTTTGDTVLYSDLMELGQPLIENTGISVISASDASQAHGHSVDLRVKWAACIVATKE